jgi:phenylalanyl-tRNA synthetase beta subunit
VIGEEKLYGDIKDIANKIKTDLKYTVSLVDIFDNQNGTKSYTLRYVIYALDHTLSGEEIENFHKSVIENFNEHGISLKV